MHSVPFQVPIGAADGPGERILVTNENCIDGEYFTAVPGEYVGALRKGNDVGLCTTSEEGSARKHAKTFVKVLELFWWSLPRRPCGRYV